MSGKQTEGMARAVQAALKDGAHIPVVARRYGVHASALRRAIKRYEDRLEAARASAPPVVESTS
jgi:transposase-like protein